MVDRASFADLPPEASQHPVAQCLPGGTDTPVAFPTESCRAVAWRLAASGLERLPVVGDAARQLLGVVSRSDLLKPSRALHEEEMQAGRTLRLRPSAADPD